MNTPVDPEGIIPPETAAADLEIRQHFAAWARYVVRDLLLTIEGDNLVTKLQTAYVILGQLTDEAVTAQKAARPPDLPLACTAGCSACCHVHVGVTPIEAVVIWRVVGAYDELRARIGEQAALIRGTTDARRWTLRAACPLLDTTTGQCGIYQIRPFGCRAWNSEDAASCERGRVVGYWPQRAIHGGVLAGLQAELTAQGLHGELGELTLALDLLADPETLPRWLRGEDAFAAARMGPAPLNRAGLRVLR